MHTILVKAVRDQVVRAEYFESKFERELGDVVTINGVRMNVGVIADTKDGAMDALDTIVKMQNKINRKIKKTEDTKFWNAVFGGPHIKTLLEQDVQDQAMIERAQQSNDYDRMIDQEHLSL